MVEDKINMMHAHVVTSNEMKQVICVEFSSTSDKIVSYAFSSLRTRYVFAIEKGRVISAAVRRTITIQLSYQIKKEVSTLRKDKYPREHLDTCMCTL